MCHSRRFSLVFCRSFLLVHVKDVVFFRVVAIIGFGQRKWSLMFKILCVGFGSSFPFSLSLSISPLFPAFCVFFLSVFSSDYTRMQYISVLYPVCCLRSTSILVYFCCCHWRWVFVRVALIHCWFLLGLVFFSYSFVLYIVVLFCVVDVFFLSFCCLFFPFCFLAHYKCLLKNIGVPMVAQWLCVFYVKCSRDKLNLRMHFRSIILLYFRGLLFDIIARCAY